MARLKELKMLYARSGNQCAFEGCNLPIFEDNGILTGECAHIKAQSKGGPRYDSSLSNEERDGFDNLILLCSRHHTIIDQEIDNYSVETLLEIKRRHEKQYCHEQLVLNNEMLQKFIMSGQIHTENLKATNDNNDVGYEFQMQIDPHADIKQVFEGLFNNINELISVANTLKESIDSSKEDLIKLFKVLNIDESILDKIPAYDNPFERRCWEMSNIALQNTTTKTQLKVLHLFVKILEVLTKLDPVYYDILINARRKLEEFHKRSFIAD